jgi:hypothetical protein
MLNFPQFSIVLDKNYVARVKRVFPSRLGLNRLIKVLFRQIASKFLLRHKRIEFMKITLVS